MDNLGKNSMKVLEENVGKTVTIEYIWFGKPTTDTGMLKKVQPYTEVVLEQETGGKMPLLTFVPFVDTTRAVQKITREDGVLLYENSLITPEHDTNGEEVYEIMASTFGEEVAAPFKPKVATATKEKGHFQPAEEVATAT